MVLIHDMTDTRLPGYILHNYIIPFAEQCYLMTLEYHWRHEHKVVVMLLKSCRRTNGTIYINLNELINSLIQKYRLSDAIPEWILQQLLSAMFIELNTYFYNRAVFDLAPPETPFQPRP